MFVLGLFVVAGILFFGYWVIQNTIQSQCETERVRFGTQLQTYFDRNKGYGTNRVVDLALPCQTTAVCFVSREVVDGAIHNAETYTTLRHGGAMSVPPGAVNVMQASINNQVPANVFFIETQGTALPVQRFSAQSAAISLPPDIDYICVEGTGGNMRLRLQGTGQVVRVSIP